MPLHAGRYNYQASYTDTSGDYNNKTGACEPLTVNKANLSVDTAIKDSSTNATVTTEPFSSKVSAPTTISTLSLHDALPIWSVGFTLYGSNTAGNSNTGTCSDLNSAGAGSSNV